MASSCQFLSKGASGTEPNPSSIMALPTYDDYYDDTDEEYEDEEESGDASIDWPDAVKVAWQVHVP